MRPALVLPALYAILDVDVVTARGWAPTNVCRAWLSAGVRLIQLRAKSLSSGAFLALADEVSGLCRAAGARLIVNDRADVAVMCGADGVHVGQDDLSPEDARRVVGPDAIVGLSTHTDAQLEAAAETPVSYLAIGPVYGTRTKETGDVAVGLEQIARAKVVARRAGVPLVAIGGITLERAPAVLAAGADSLAVITNLLEAGDLREVEERARAWMRVSPPSPD